MAPELFMQSFLKHDGLICLTSKHMMVPYGHSFRLRASIKTVGVELSSLETVLCYISGLAKTVHRLCISMVWRVVPPLGIF